MLRLPFACSEVYMNELLALCNVDIIHISDHLANLIPLDRRFPGINDTRRFDPVGRKKLLRLLAGLSARSMVAPIDLVQIQALLKQYDALRRSHTTVPA